MGQGAKMKQKDWLDNNLYHSGPHWQSLLDCKPYEQNPSMNTRSFKELHDVDGRLIGYRILRTSSWITTEYCTLIFNSDGTAKMTVKADKNYVGRYQYTKYYDYRGCQIQQIDRKSPTSRTVYQNQRKQLRAK